MKRKAPKLFTQAEDQVIREGVMDGKTMNEIGKELDRKPYVVRNRAIRIGAIYSQGSVAIEVDRSLSKTLAAYEDQLTKVNRELTTIKRLIPQLERDRKEAIRGILRAQKEIESRAGK